MSGTLPLKDGVSGFFEILGEDSSFRCYNRDK